MTVGLLPNPAMDGPTGPTGPNANTTGPTGNAGATGPTGPSIKTTDVACFKYALPNGTDEVDSTPGAYVTRSLNTTVYNGISGCSLSANQVTVPAGTYYVRVIAPTGIRSTSPNQAGSHKAIVYDNTAGANLVMGISHQNSDASSANPINHALVQGSFTVSQSTTIKVLHRTSGSGTFGNDMNFGDDEIYTTITFFRLA